MKKIFILLAITLSLSAIGGMGREGAFAQTANQPGSGNALDFDGVDDYVNIPHIASLDITGDMTISAWVKANSLASGLYHGVVTKRTWGGKCPWGMMILGNDNTLYWYSADCCPASSMESLLKLNMDAAIVPGDWVHLAITVSGTTVTGYINGIQKDSKTIAYRAATNDDMVVGQSTNQNNNEPFDGLIDEVRIWNYTRTITDIREDMNRKLTGNETGLIGYWRMDNGTGNITFDSSPNGNDGTLQ